MSPHPEKTGYCFHCGNPLSFLQPQGDSRKRYVCSHCGSVRYESPDIVVGCIATWEDKVLWLKRGNDPRKGFWALPTGFMEASELPEEAAVRELHEETGATVDPSTLALYIVGALPHINQVNYLYRAELTSPYCQCTDEAMDVALLDEASAPWNDCAYPMVLDLIRCFYREHKEGAYGLYSARYIREQFLYEKIGISVAGQIATS